MKHTPVIFHVGVVLWPVCFCDLWYYWPWKLFTQVLLDKYNVNTGFFIFWYCIYCMAHSFLPFFLRDGSQWSHETAKHPLVAQFRTSTDALHLYIVHLLYHGDSFGHAYYVCMCKPVHFRLEVFIAASRGPMACRIYLLPASTHLSGSFKWV